ncbi:ankyrin repeat domain-containing protein [Aquimarina sp. 2201CG5-10]|uniref:ankyrin repeat domain-containing protein n=1 Tax=Aquimarina callyspongiae TaxID=3098150 RepID=UPI002AB4AD06|nr:ankyrin repeat domain-containing protein [Aquimarina sp. 2201CG5-10]MDY8138789.1 ankyrin repeat domain-containing protein [Aquimarina sp. 2201CG5-10]
MKKTALAMIAMVMCISLFSVNAEAKVTSKSHNYDLTVQKVNTFCMAIVKGDVVTVKKMIELGSDVNEKSRGMTPLMYAARYNRVDIIKLLVKKGANIKAKDGQGYNAMKFAKLSNAKEAMALLKELS